MTAPSPDAGRGGVSSTIAEVDTFLLATMTLLRCWNPAGTLLPSAILSLNVGACRRLLDVGAVSGRRKGELGPHGGAASRALPVRRLARRGYDLVPQGATQEPSELLLQSGQVGP